MFDANFKFEVGLDISEAKKKILELNKELKMLRNSYQVFNDAIQQNAVSNPKTHTFDIGGKYGQMTIDQLARTINDVVNMVTAGERLLSQHSAKLMRDGYVSALKEKTEAKKRLNELKALNEGGSSEAKELQRIIRAAQLQQNVVKGKAKKLDNQSLLAELKDIDDAHKKELETSRRFSDADTKARQKRIKLKEQEKAAQKKINEDLKNYLRIRKDINDLERKRDSEPNIDDNTRRAIDKSLRDKIKVRDRLENRYAGDSRFNKLKAFVDDKEKLGKIDSNLKRSKEQNEKDLATYSNNIKQQEVAVKKLVELQKQGLAGTHSADRLKQDIVRLVNDNNDIMNRSDGTYLESMKKADAAYKQRIQQWNRDGSVQDAITKQKKAVDGYNASLKKNAELHASLAKLIKNGQGQSETANKIRNEINEERYRRDAFKNDISPDIFKAIQEERKTIGTQRALLQRAERDVSNRENAIRGYQDSLKKSDNLYRELSGYENAGEGNSQYAKDIRRRMSDERQYRSNLKQYIDPQTLKQIRDEHGEDVKRQRALQRAQQNIADKKAALPTYQKNLNTLNGLFSSMATMRELGISNLSLYDNLKGQARKLISENANIMQSVDIETRKTLENAHNKWASDVYNKELSSKNKRQIDTYKKNNDFLFTGAKELAKYRELGLINSPQAIQLIGDMHDAASVNRAIRSNAKQSRNDIVSTGIQSVDSARRDKQEKALASEYAEKFKRRDSLTEQYKDTTNKRTFAASAVKSEIDKLDTDLAAMERLHGNSIWFRELQSNLSNSKLSSNLEKEEVALKKSIQAYREYYHELLSLQNKLSKVKDTNTQAYKDGKDRERFLEGRLKDLEFHNIGNQAFSSAIDEVKSGYKVKGISTGLDEQVSQEAQTISSKMSSIRHEMERLALARINDRKNAKQYADDLVRLRKEYARLEQAMKDANKYTGRGGLHAFGSSIKSHLNWIISGTIVDKLYEIPMAIKDVSIEVDNLSRKITQNIELSGDFVDNNDRLNRVSRDLVYSSFNIANQHGMKMQDILEMMQIMSRRYKDPNELKYYTNLAAIMSKLDFVDPAVAAETFEAITISLGLNAKEAADFVNEFSIATHTMRINGQDLLEAFQRSAPVLKQFNLSSAESISLVATLSTTLGREGKYIGNAITGIAVRLLNEKNQNFFKKIGISMTKETGEMKNLVEILKEYSGHYNKLSEEDKNKELASIFGAYRLVPGASAIQEQKLLDEVITNVGEKASDELTKKLEKVQLDSYESKLHNFNNAIYMSSYIIGDALAPAVTSVLNAITLLVTEFVKFDRLHDGTVEKILALIAGLYGYARVLGIVQQKYGSFKGALNAAVTASKTLQSGILNLGIEMSKTTNATHVLANGFNFLSTRASLAFAGITAGAMALAATLAIVIGLIYAIGKAKKQSGHEEYINDYVIREHGSWDKVPNEGFGAKLLAWKKENDYLNSDEFNRSLLIEGHQGVEDVLGDKLPSERINEHRDNTEFLAMEGDAIRYSNKVIEDINNRNKTNTNTPVNTDNDKNKNKDNKTHRTLKNTLNSKFSTIKNDVDTKEKEYQSGLKDISFDEEILGKSAKTYIDASRLHRDRLREVMNENIGIATEIKRLENKIAEIIKNAKKGDINEDDDEVTDTEKQLEIYNENLSKFKNLYAEQIEKEKELGREIRKRYMITPEKALEEQKERLETKENILLARATNKRNAFNNTVKIDIQLEHARANKNVLEKELRIATNNVKKWEDEIDNIRRGRSDMVMAEAQRELQIARDTQDKKVLAIEQANQKIADLEYEHTKKIREGLHGVVNDLLIQGKSLKDIWNNLWTDLAEEALRALMGIQDGQQSTLGAIAARAFGLDKATPEQKGIETQITATTTNTNSLDANTRAIQGLTTSLANGSYADGVDEISKAALGMSSTISDTLSKGVYADSMDSISKDSMSVGVSSFASQGKGKSADSTMAALGILAAATSMSGSKKASKFASLLSIAIPFIGGGKAGGAGASTAAAGKGKGKKKAIASTGTATQWADLMHDGSVVGITQPSVRYYHNGGNVGTSVVPYLKSDEVNAVLQTGEEVVSRKDRRSNELMSEQNKHMADAMQRMAEGSNTNVTFAIQAIDSKSVVQLLSENGDAIMNILRKQSAYGNGRI